MSKNMRRVKITKKDISTLIILVLIIPLIVGLLVYSCYISHEKAVYRSELKATIGYEAANDKCVKDIARYGNNHRVKYYQDAVADLKTLDEGIAIYNIPSQNDINTALRTLRKAREEYIAEAERLRALKEENERKAEQEKLEAQERAAEERRRKAASSYVEPDAYQMSISGKMLEEVIILSAKDIDTYFGRLGWEEYDRAFFEFNDIASKYLYRNGELEYDGENFYRNYYSIDDVMAALKALSEARRSMVIQQAGDNSIVMDFSKNQDDPYVYTTETGIRYHWRETCRGLDNANDVFVERRSDAQARGLTECEICY